MPEAGLLNEEKTERKPSLAQSEHRVPAFFEKLWGTFREAAEFLWVNRWIYCAIALAGMLACCEFVLHERFFHFWDTSNFFDLSLETQQYLHISLYRGLRHVAHTLADDYNAVFSLPMLPVLEAFGTTRTVFIAINFLVFLFPLSILTGGVASVVVPGQKKQVALTACLMLLSVPACWFTTFRGYPDCGGAVFVYAAIWIYLSRGALRDLKDAFWIAALLALSVVFRRHYVYCVAALAGAIFLDIGISYWLDRKATLRITAFRYRNALIAFGGAVALVAAVAPQFVVRSVLSAAGGYPSTYIAYQSPRLASLLEIIRNHSPFLLLPAACGYALLFRSPGASRTGARFIGLFAAVWVALWLGIVRQETTHYPHALPLFIAIGLASLWLRLGTLRAIPRRFAFNTLLLFLILHFNFVTSGIWPSRLLQSYLPDALLPLTARPMVNPAYDQIVRLVGFLRSRVKPADTVVVAASSTTINPALLEHAEHELFRDNHIHIANTPQVDERDGLPTAQILAAHYVVVAKPFQHHMRAEHQRCVEVLVEAFERSWPISKDFVLLPTSFSLGSENPGGEILVYQRVLKSSPAVASDTYERISRFVRSASKTAD